MRRGHARRRHDGRQHRALHEPFANPNAYSRIIEVGSRVQDKHIIVFAMRDLEGEELQMTTSSRSAGTRLSAIAEHPTAGDE